MVFFFQRGCGGASFSLQPPLTVKEQRCGREEEVQQTQGFETEVSDLAMQRAGTTRPHRSVTSKTPSVPTRLSAARSATSHTFHKHLWHQPDSQGQIKCNKLEVVLIAEAVFRDLKLMLLFKAVNWHPVLSDLCVKTVSNETSYTRQMILAPCEM